MKYFIIFYILIASSFATSLQMYDTVDYYLDKNSNSYKITSKYQFVNFDKIKRNYNYFNREKIAKKYRYKQNGYFETKNISIKFTKSYELSNKLVFLNSKFKYKNYLIKSKKCTIKKSDLNRISCKRVKFFEKDKLIRVKTSKKFIL